MAPDCVAVTVGARRPRPPWGEPRRARRGAAEEGTSARDAMSLEVGKEGGGEGVWHEERTRA